MKRNFAALEDKVFDLLIIGGGITGACIARDATTRGLRVALVEQSDFISATSAAPSKLIHGGLRYLRNFELGLVRESLAERRVWERIAPHQVRPLPFLLPTDQEDKRLLGVGLTLYDLLSFDRNRVKDPAQKLPGHKWLDAEAAAKMEPVLGGQAIAGAFLYYDCQMRSPERLGLECLIDAARRGAVVVNYAEASGFLREGKEILGATVFDRVTGHTGNVRARITLNAAGPWADRLLGLAEEGEPSRHLLRSKGIHLITRQLTRDHAVTASIPDELGGGHMFLLPWRGKTIIGTTDTAYEGDPDHLTVTAHEITDYLAVINKTVPGVRLSPEDVIHAYGGLRPLIQDKADKGNPYNASRKSEVVDHQKENGLKGLFSAIGGKWTTSRLVAEKAVTQIARRIGKKVPKSYTGKTPLPGGWIDGLDTSFDTMNGRFPDLAGARLDELVFTYGSEAEKLATLAAGNAALAERLSPHHGEIAAQVIHAVREEMALTLEDVVFRRTGLGTLGFPGEEPLARVTQIMARELGWDGARVEEELRDVHRLFYAEHL